MFSALISFLKCLITTFKSLVMRLFRFLIRLDRSKAVKKPPLLLYSPPSTLLLNQLPPGLKLKICQNNRVTSRATLLINLKTNTYTAHVLCICKADNSAFFPHSLLCLSWKIAAANICYDLYKAQL